MHTETIKKVVKCGCILEFNDVEEFVAPEIFRAQNVNQSCDNFLFIYRISSIIQFSFFFSIKC